MSGKAMPPNSKDRDLRDRASRVIPGGMWGHMNAARMPPAFPQYFSHGRGSRLWDADGTEYLDFMCAYGPMILGYSDPDVAAAVEAVGGDGAILNGPTGVAVELAELLVDTIPHADWAMFQKNGTDATTTCVTLARAGTGRRKILVAEGAYHGAVPW
ncbi:MAG: aminotransferase class III-fold pyridoxal phosphate-dependent enzyme, partial [Pseudomonadota bacterium]